jgi:transposase
LVNRISLLEKEVVDLRNENKRLMEENQRLKNQLNSKTSHFPSSHTIIKPILSLREPTDKKSGGQLGRTGITRERIEIPDVVIDHKPSHCDFCGSALETFIMEESASRQVFDIPLLPQEECTEHRIYRAKCRCGKTTTSLFPKHVTAPVQYGKNTSTLVSYLSTFHFIPYKRLSELMNISFGINISQGSIANLLSQSKDYLLPIYDQIKTRMVDSKVVGGDETGMSINGKKAWMFGFQTSRLTYLKASKTRGFSTIEETFERGFPNSIYVSDCLPMQLKIEAKKHQICLAHLMREINGFIEGHKDNRWSPKIKALFKDALELKKTDFICPAKIKKCEKKLEEVLFKLPIPENKKIQAFVKRLQKNRHSIFTFLYHKEVPPDNNGTERVIRNVKVKTKVSGFFKSFEGAERFAVIRSVMDTILKNNQNLFDTFSLIPQYSFSST